MKLVFLPTLYDMRGMLGDKLYVDFVWMWREQEQKSQARERHEKWAAKLSGRRTDEAGAAVMTWPQLRGVRTVSETGAVLEPPVAVAIPTLPPKREIPARVGGRRTTAAIRF